MKENIPVVRPLQISQEDPFSTNEGPEVQGRVEPYPCCASSTVSRPSGRPAPAPSFEPGAITADAGPREPSSRTGSSAQIGLLPELYLG